MLKILRRASQNKMHTVSIQPAQSNPGTSPETPLKVLTSGTYRGLSEDSKRTNTKIYGLQSNNKIVFYKQQSLHYVLIPVFYRKKKKNSNVLNGNFHETSTGSSCGTSRAPYNGTFQGHLRSVGQTCFLNPTHKHIKRTLTGYSRLFTDYGSKNNVKKNKP